MLHVITVNVNFAVKTKEKETTAGCGYFRSGHGVIAQIQELRNLCEAGIYLRPLSVILNKLLFLLKLLHEYLEGHLCMPFPALWTARSMFEISLFYWQQIFRDSHCLF